MGGNNLVKWQADMEGVEGVEGMESLKTKEDKTGSDFKDYDTNVQNFGAIWSLDRSPNFEELLGGHLKESKWQCTAMCTQKWRDRQHQSSVDDMYL